MVFVRQQNTWFASGKFVGSYIDKKTNKVINGTAIIYPYKYTNVFLWTSNNDVKKQILSLSLQKEIVDPDDVEMLQDLIVTCLNQAFKQVDDAQTASMGKYNIPGLM